MSFLRNALPFLSGLAACPLALFAPGAALAQTPPSPAATEGPPKAPFVYVSGPEGVLEGHAKARKKAAAGANDDDDDDDDDEAWQRICALPCSRTLDPAMSYRIGGPGVTGSDTFRLPAGQSTLRLDVDPGSRASRVTGIVFIPVGATALGIGLLFAAAGAISEEDDVTRGGFIAAAAGAFVMTGGIMLVRSNRTTVTTSVGGEPSVQLASGLALTPRGLVF